MEDSSRSGSGRFVRGAASSVALAALVTIVAACKEPTAVLVVVKTNVPYVAGISVGIAAASEAAYETAAFATVTTEPWNIDGMVGTIMVVPAGAQIDTVGVRVTMGTTADPSACGTGATLGATCIEARRVLRFVSHTSLRLNVALWQRCEGVGCPSGQTCNRSGACVSARVDNAQCERAEGCTVEGDPNGDGPLDEGSVEGRDATTDASTGNADARAGDADARAADALADAQGDGTAVMNDGSAGTCEGGTCAPACLGGQLGSPWPMFRRCETGRALSPAPSLATANVKWDYSVAGVNSAPAIAADGTVYFNAGTKLYALTSAGGFRWSYTMGNTVQGSPSIGADGTVYVVSADGFLNATKPDGTFKWNLSLTGGNLSSPVIGADGRIYLEIGPKKLFAVNPAGTVAWPYTFGDFSFTTPAIASDGTIYGAPIDGPLVALNPDGSFKWSYPVVGVGSSSPAIGPDGTVYIGGSIPAMTAVRADGSFKWSLSDANCRSGTPIIGPDGTLYTGRTVSLCAINPATGAVRWTFPSGGGVGVAAEPAVASDGTIYFGGQDGYFYAVNPDGTQKWRSAMFTDYVMAPAIGADGTVYVGDRAGGLHAFGP